MHNWYKEDWRFIITVLRVGAENRPESCRLGFEPGDEFTSTYECPANFCPLAMNVAYPLMTAVRSGGDLRQLGGNSPQNIEFCCPDGGVVRFGMVAAKFDHQE